MERFHRQLRRLGIAGVAALLAVGLAASASAQLENLPPLPAEATDALRTATEPAPEVKKRSGQDLDTDYTPIVKESPFFSLHQGAFYRDENNGGAESEADFNARRSQNQSGASELVTHWDDELTDVAFTNTRNGFAGGQRKIDCDGDGSPDTYVPVIYRYADSPEGLRWLRPTAAQGGFLGDCDSAGFIGQIAWFQETGMAIAVGGDGSYPHRAPAYGKDVDGKPCAPDPTKPFGGNCDQAGLGRAWLYNHGRWQELDTDEQTFPNDELGANEQWGKTIHGMTALDCSPLSQHRFCFAGALGQIWPVLVNVEGASEPCKATGANACVSFPANGVMPGLFRGPITGSEFPADGRFDMDSRAPYASSDGAPGMVPPPPPEDPPTPLNNPTADPEWAAWLKATRARPQSGEADNAYRFRFRVRQIRIENDASKLAAIAVTEGCCAGTGTEGGVSLGPASDYPSVLLFERADTGLVDIGGRGWGWRLWSADHAGQWYEHTASYGLPDEQRRALGPPPNARQDWPNSFYAAMLDPAAMNIDRLRVGLVASPGGPPPAGGLPERPSLVTEPICLTRDYKNGSTELVQRYDLSQPGQAFSALRTQLAGVRLLDGDGDELVAFTYAGPPYAGAPSNASRNTGQTCGQGYETRARNAEGLAPRGDAVPDWSVGELRSTEIEGRGARGLAFSTVSRPTLVSEVIDLGWTGDGERIVPAGGALVPPPPDLARATAILADPLGNPPTGPEQLAAYLQSQHFFTGSYGLSAIDYLDGTGSGWAVGRRGAIVQLGGGEGNLAAKARVEPAPPPLGAKRPGQAPERTPYEVFDPPATAPGAVPALGARPPERLREHAIRFTGAPADSLDYANRRNELGQLIISRDGVEGWGLDRETTARSTVAMTLFQLKDGGFSRCDPEGIAGAIEPDSVCAALAPLRAYSVNGQIRGVAVTAAVRIPYEYDDDAANDDEFEIFAVATGYRTPAQQAANPAADVAPTLLRYREGIWEVESDPATAEFLNRELGFSRNYRDGNFSRDFTMSFTAPGDGWTLGGRPNGGNNSLLRFDGERWIQCTTQGLDPDPDWHPKDSKTWDSKEPSVRYDAEVRAQWCDDPDRLTISADLATEAPIGVLSSPAKIQDIDTFTGLATAGDRLYLYGYRTVGGENPIDYPLILCKDAGERWRNDAGCGLDPGLAVREDTAGEGLTGRVTGLSVAIGKDGIRRGWATGFFGGREGATGRWEGAETTLLRLGSSGWEPYTDEGALSNRFRSAGSLESLADLGIVALPDGGGLIGGIYRFEGDIGRWRAFPDSADGGRRAFPDARGGAWLASTTGDLISYTDRPPRPVFSEAPTPLPRREESFTGLSGRPDGSLWATTGAGTLYRYARSTGWDRVSIPGWRAERATVAHAAYAVAVNDSGVGVAVGREGRIAGIAGSEVRLDAAAGTLCDLTEVIPPCGTSRHLRAAAVSLEGAAMTGGDDLSLLWRPSATGGFRAIRKPESAASAEITGVSLPEAGVGYLTTNQGQLFRGLEGRAGARCEAPAASGAWCWLVEGTDANGRLLTRDPTGARSPAALRAVSVDARGHGYAVGDRGVLLQRTAGCDGANADARCWRLLRSGVSYDLTAVTQRGEHALIGGTHGLVLTRAGERFAVARAADRDINSLLDGYTGAVVGLALSGGPEQGQAEAWAATDASTLVMGSESTLNTSQLFHYASDPSEPLLDPARGASGPLADSPAPREGELSLAALGKAECHAQGFCLESTEANHRALSRRSVEGIVERSREPGGPVLAVFTGDFVNGAGSAGATTTEGVVSGMRSAGVRQTSGVMGLRESRAWLAEPLERAGLGFFAAIGAQDLAPPHACYQTIAVAPCTPNLAELLRAGLSDAWREAFAPEPAPWGKGKRFTSERYEARGLSRSGSSLGLPEPTIDAAGDEVEVKLVSGGARTHYAFDLIERQSGKKLTRFVFVDNSLKSLAASDPIQHPTELEAGESGTGQAAWLKRLLCTKGSGSRCSREPGQPAVVIANAPTYSYANGDPRFWAKDAAVFESILLQNNATAVVSGSLGWNGRYWATAPGLHEPCEGEGFREQPPQPGTASCRGRSSAELPLGAGGVAPVANQLASALGPASPALNQISGAVNSIAGEGLLPFVVASGAGGKLAGQGAGEGFFHGYTIVRVPANADPAAVLVEQRPLFEFLQITAASHVLRPGQKMTLKGVGRGPLALDSSKGGAGQPQVASFDPVDSAAIGHRYDLVQADPKKPWLPKRDPSTAGSPGGDPSAQDDSAGGTGAYVRLDPSIATLDPQTGQVKVGRGNHPRAFAVGILSVGCSGTQAGSDGTCDPSDPGVHAATFPLVFEPRRTFVPKTETKPEITQIQARAGAALPPPPQAPPAGTAVQPLNLPPPPSPPALPPIDVPEVNAPVPPIPPPPPIQQSPVPLDLSASAPGVTIAPQTTVIPPPAPPIQPAPPGGARREARQRQSATQSSGSGSGSEESSRVGDHSQASGGDLAQSPPAMTRRTTHEFTATGRARAEGGSMTAYYGASVTLLALIAALGWNYGRPGPHRRSPTVPAPARAWARRRW